MHAVHATEVKLVLASVATALAVHQLVLAAIGYRKLRIIEATPAFMAHRASGSRHHRLPPARRHLGRHRGSVPGVNRQLIGSLLVAAHIVLVTIIVRLEQREERREDRD